MPIFRSSTSKVILASMSRGRLKRLWRNHQDEPDCKAIGADWLSFWKSLQAIKRQGYWTSAGELDKGLAGLAAPILYGTGEVAGSMSLVFTREEFENYDTGLLGSRLRGAALQLSRTLAELGRSLPPKAEPADESRPKRKGRAGKRPAATATGTESFPATRP